MPTKKKKETIQLLLMVKNGQELITSCLESYLGQVDRYVVLDTGSTDNTISLVKIFGFKNNQYVEIFTQQFMGFSDSRNSLIEIATNPLYSTNKKQYDWSIMIDDSYHLHGSLRDSLIPRFDKELYSVRIRNDNDPVFYMSSRIFRTNYLVNEPKIRYVGELHETPNFAPQGYFADFYLVDVSCESHKKRTFQRNIGDLKILKNKEDPSSLYYTAMTKFNLYRNGIGSSREVFDALLRRGFVQGDPEERMFTIITMGSLCQESRLIEKAVEFYLLAAKTFPQRLAECYFYAYIASGNVEYLKVAYDNRAIDYNALFRFPFCNDIYGEGHISLAWQRYLLMEDIKSIRSF